MQLPDSFLTLKLGNKKNLKTYIEYLIGTITFHTTFSAGPYYIDHLYPISKCPAYLKFSEVIPNTSQSWWLWPTRKFKAIHISGHVPGKPYSAIPYTRYLVRFTCNDKDYIAYRHGFNTGQNYWVIDCQTKAKYQLTRYGTIPQLLEVLHNPELTPCYINTPDFNFRKVILNLLINKE